MKNSTSPSIVNAIAGFADRAVSTSLKPDLRKLYKRNILDSLGCAISALPGAPFAALREQFAEYRSGGSCKARKTQLIRDIVKVTHESIGSDPKIINVLLFEHPADNMSISGRVHGEDAPKETAEQPPA
jgi:phenylpyruvate tautomerase PptA (4-oxalocrotonate tautomerase family)